MYNPSEAHREPGFSSGVLLLLISAAYTGEEDGLPFVCRPHLPGVVHHALLVAAGAAPVDHGSLQLRAVLVLQSHHGLLHRVKDHRGADLQPRELCYRDAEGAAGAAHHVLDPRQREDIPTLRTEVWITSKT